MEHKINPIAKPIQLDENGNRIEEIKENKNIKEPKKNKNVFVIVLISFILIMLIGYLLISINKKEEPNKETTTTTTTINSNITFSSYSLSEELYIKEIDNTKVGNFNIYIKNHELYINDISINKIESLYSKVGLIDNYLILMLKNNKNIIYIIDSKAKIINKIDSIDKMEITNLTINPINIIIKTSIKDIESKCKEKDDIIVTKNYSLTYIGKGKFNELKPVYEEKMSIYKKKNNICN